MKTYPTIPPIADAPESLLDSGHLWIQELVDGELLRFQLRESGVLRFGDDRRTYDPDDVPLPFQHAVSHIQTTLDRGALREAVSDVESVVFFGVATQKQAIEYDWERLPSFLGFDIWSAEREGFLPPDTVEQIFERLGIQPVNTVAKEVRARDFDPDSYEIPQSNWYDGPAAGVVVRNKSGGRAKLRNPQIPESTPTPVEASASELADDLAPPSRFSAVATRLDQRGQPITFDALSDRVLEEIVREHHRRLLHGQSEVDISALRSEIAERTSQFLDSQR